MLNRHLETIIIKKVIIPNQNKDAKTQKWSLKPNVFLIGITATVRTKKQKSLLIYSIFISSQSLTMPPSLINEPAQIYQFGI
jgi:hypothetical protein